MRSRRDFFTSTAAALACSSGVKILGGFQGARDTRLQRTIVVMFDGFGIDYFENSSAPTLRRWQKDGLYKRVKGVMPQSPTPTTLRSAVEHSREFTESPATPTWTQ